MGKCFLKCIWIWNLFSLLSFVLLEVHSISLWGCETGKSVGTLNCIFGDFDTKVAETKSGYGKFFSSSKHHQHPQRDYGYHHRGGGGYHKPQRQMSYGRRGWNNYKPQRMHYRPMKKMYSYPVHRRQHHQGWKPRYNHGHNQHKPWYPKKKKKEVKVQIIVHCPSEHPMCKTHRGQSHGYGKQWKPQRKHYGHDHNSGYEQHHHGWKRPSYRPRRQKYVRKKWDENKWEDSYYDHDEEKLCNCKKEPKQYHDAQVYTVQHQVVYDDPVDQYRAPNVYDDFTTDTSMTTQLLEQPQQNTASRLEDFVDEMEAEKDYIIEPEERNRHEPKDTFVVVQATQPPKLSLKDMPTSSEYTETGESEVFRTAVEKSLPLKDTAISGNDSSQNVDNSTEELKNQPSNESDKESVSNTIHSGREEDDPSSKHQEKTQTSPMETEVSYEVPDDNSKKVSKEKRMFLQALMNSG